ncbi:MAG: VPS10 domain-containing protein [Terriglobales bacterium]
MSIRRSAAYLFAIVSALALAVVAQGPAHVKPALWSGMHYRLIGPFRGGRVTTVAGVPSEPDTFYFGSTGGGIWKTTDAGANWHNVSDKYFALGSMGAIAVAPSNPNIIYVGTGSADIRSNVSIGRGVYKSIDAGQTWTFVGLRQTGQIRFVVIDPRDPDTVYIAAQGDPFANGPHRGVYRTRDGGQTWQKVLYVSPELGASALAMDPSNPEVLYAGLWHGLRQPWTIISGSEASQGAGIYKSTDGGDHWTKLGHGLPDQLFGRSNVAISAADPQRIYALIEAKPGGGLYRSGDGGASWKLINGRQQLWTRPFYYNVLGVDPNNADVVYVGDENWFKSTDGGRTFQRERTPHGDNHALWINPKNSLDMIQANDGGANVSLDGGKTWSTQLNQPTAEIYQVAVDDQYPYRVYGAQQDDDTVIIPSLPLGDGQAFRTGPGCETGPIIPDPANPEIVYGGCKGQFTREDIRTRNEMNYWIGAQSLYGNAPPRLIDRFQRVAPMEVSPHPPFAVYYGSQYLFRTLDGGVHWQRISPDLTAHPPGTQIASGSPITRDATGEEVYSTLYTIRVSPVQAGVIWTGSNDGPIYVTRDNGRTWTNVTPKSLPPGGRVQNIEPSPYSAGGAYAAVYRYLLGDFHPYIYRTDDFGTHWTLLTDGANGIPVDSPTRVVREDPVRPGLLYAGTEFGMYISFDNGGHWQSFQLNLPHTPVTDIKIAHGDLILSTQGRSDWILDNLGPLEQLTPHIEASAAHLFRPRTAIRSGAGYGFFGFGRAAGPQYPAAGAMIGYYLALTPATPLQLKILDASGNVIQTFSSNAPVPRRRAGFGGFGRFGAPPRLAATPGMHRFTWNLRYPGPWESARQPHGGNGPLAVPGRYEVRLSYGGWSQTQPLTIKEDPRNIADGVTQADLEQQFEHNQRVLALVSQVNQLVARVRRAERHPPGSVDRARLHALAAALITPPIRYSQPGLQDQISYLYGMTNRADQRIGQDAIDRYQVLKTKLGALQKQVDDLLGGAGN